MFRLTTVGVLVLMAVGLLLVSAQAIAAPASCTNFDQFGQCIVQAAQPGGAADSVATTQNPPPTAAQPCTDQGAVVPCELNASRWVQSMACYASLLTPQPPVSSPIWEGHTDGAIYTCAFHGPVAGTGLTFWSATPPAGPAAVDPEQLAREALQTIVVPSPSIGRYPDGRLPDGRPYSVVGTPTWFWTSATDWHPRTARANAGAIWAEVTVTPARLSFAPGDGAPAASCSGPGTPWSSSSGAWSPSPSGCDHSYRHSSIDQPGGTVTATYQITWRASWTSSTGATGELPELTTTATSTFAVAEAQTVVTQ